MTASLRLEVLGGLRITLNGVPVTGFVSRKVEALLCYVAVEPRPHLRQSLAALLWADLPEADAAANLRQALANLRRVLDPYLVITRQTVAFNRDSAYWTDVECFEAQLRTAVSASNLTQLRDAIDLYQGDFLEGFAVRDAPNFDEWAVLQRERLHNQALHALDTLVQRYLSVGDYDAGITYATRLVGLDPWREEARRQLMWLYVRSGQWTLALAQYETCRRILKQELGVEPMVETTALYERIKAAQAARPHTLPFPATPFIGRTTEQNALSRRLAEPASRLVTIVGPGGIGKTRLALQMAATWAARFLHGARVVNLASVSSTDMLISTIVTALGVAADRTDDPHIQLRHSLADKDMLLVLDNFEQLVDVGADVVLDIMRHAPDVKLLVTTRERLQLQDEYLIDLEGLEVPSPTTTDIESYSAVELFVQSACKRRPDFVLTEVDKPAVAQICRLVEGLPLGLELAAAWTRVLSCEEIACEISRSLEFLSTSLRDVPARHRSFRAVLDHSWNLLDGDEQRVLRQLSVFHDGFQRQAAEHVAGASIRQLAALVDKSLLRSNGHTASQRRYDLHEIVRQYAFEQLQAAGEAEQTRNRHLDYFLELAEQAAPHLAGAEEGRWVLHLETEHSNLRSALDWAVQGEDVEKAARMCGAVWRFWQTRGYFTEGRDWIARVLKLTDGDGWSGDGSKEGRHVDMRVRAHVLKGAGVLAWAQSDYAEARTAFETSLSLYHELDDKDGIAAVSGNLGVLALYQGRYEQAMALLQTSLTLRRELDDAWGIAICLNNLGALAGKQGDLTRAQTYYEEGLALYRELGYERGIATLLGNLGDVAEDRGDLERASRFSTESLVMHRKLGNAAGTVAALTRLGSLALRQNDLPQARSNYAESLTLLQDLGDKEYIAVCLEGFAAIAAAERQWGRAVRLWSAAEALRVAINVPLSPGLRPQYEHSLNAARMQLEERVFAGAWAEGQAMAVEQVVAYAMQI